MLAEVEIGYSQDGVLTALDADTWERLRVGFPALDLPVEKPEKFSLPLDKRWHIIDLATTGELLIDVGLTFEIKRFKGCRKVAGDGPRTVNLQVSIPNLLLFAVDEVMVEEDCCTERLQDRLNDRWRILAVCPPANQRRPDYVLGRQKETDA